MFYDDGLCFECQRCLYCCSQEPGYVFLSEKDIENGSQVLGLSKEEFIAIYCRYVDYGNYSMVSLKEKDNYDCIFLTKNGCSLKMVAPSMKDGQVSAGHIHSGSQLLNLVQIGKAKVKAAQVLEREEKSPEKR